MSDDPIAILLSVFGAFMILILFIPIIGILADSLNQQKCEQYINQVSQKDAEINGLKKQLNTLESNLNICRTEYEYLLEENITKADIEEIKQDLHTTHVNMENLNQQFDVISNKYVTIYNNLFFYYQISFILNLAFVVALPSLFAFDFVAVNIFNFDLRKKIFNLLVRIKNKLSVNVSKPGEKHGSSN